MAGKPKSSGSEGTGSSSSQESQEPSADIKALADGLSKLSESMSTAITQLAQNQTQLAESNQAILAKLSEPPPTAPEEKPLSIQDMKWEEMSRADMVQAILDKTQHGVEQILKDKLVPQIQNISTEQSKMSTSQALAYAQSKHVDFMEWKDAILQLSKQHPNLDVEQLYFLARGADPEKATKIDADIVAKAKVAEETKEFGGLTPTNSPTNIENNNLSDEESALAAWDETFGESSDDGFSNLFSANNLEIISTSQ